MWLPRRDHLRERKYKNKELGVENPWSACRQERSGGGVGAEGQHSILLTGHCKAFTLKEVGNWETTGQS